MRVRTDIKEGNFKIKAGFVESVNENQISQSPETDFAIITTETGIYNGTEVNEGELLLNSDIDVRAEIDIDGTLNLTDLNAEKVYFINEYGELIKRI